MQAVVQNTPTAANGVTGSFEGSRLVASLILNHSRFTSRWMQVVSMIQEDTSRQAPILHGRGGEPCAPAQRSSSVWT
jgi:hypothetical protein